MKLNDVGPIPVPIRSSPARNIRPETDGQTVPSARPRTPAAIEIEPITAVVRNPSRTTTLAAIVTLIAQARNNGVIIRPAAVAVPPSTPWI